MKTVVAVVAILQNTKNEFLLTKRNEPEKKFHGFWHLPGGSINEKETPEEALHREINEELHINIRIQKMIPRVFTQFRANWKGFFLCYTVLYDPKQKIILNEEASEYGWFSLSEIQKLSTLPLSLAIIQEAIRNNKMSPLSDSD